MHLFFFAARAFQYFVFNLGALVRVPNEIVSFFKDVCTRHRTQFHVKLLGRENSSEKVRYFFFHPSKKKN